mmetsp:Transcript_20231/g.25012  ORF Transcript_20231/g.25012 Transcript_20231/m.25012 type:complete len:179 (-) Transcript_20231:154-690(-)
MSDNSARCEGESAIGSIEINLDQSHSTITIVSLQQESRGRDKDTHQSVDSVVIIPIDNECRLKQKTPKEGEFNRDEIESMKSQQNNVPIRFPRVSSNITIRGGGGGNGEDDAAAKRDNVAARRRTRHIANGTQRGRSRVRTSNARSHGGRRKSKHNRASVAREHRATSNSMSRKPIRH